MFNIKRFPHILQVKKKTVVPSNFLFFDTETKIEGTLNEQGQGNNVLWFGWCFAYRLESGKRTREVWTRFTTPQQFFDCVRSRLCENKPLYVYAHNLGFDLPIVGFFELWKKLGLRIQFWAVDSPPTIIKAKWDGKSVVFVDTLNYWQMSLAKLGESVGQKKLPMPKSKRAKVAWDEYCKSDVKVLDSAITKLIHFVQQHRCGSLSLTLAGLSMQAYRHRFMKHDIYIHDRVKVCAMERDAYYGGLVECYHIGKVRDGTITNVDVTSHYPAVMLNEFPCKLLKEIDRPKISDVSSLLKRHAIIAQVNINSRNETFPKRVDKKLCYVSGRFRTVLSGPEIERALKTNSVHSFGKVAVYERKRLFRDFVRYFWNVRCSYLRDGNSVDSFFAKILLNSLYGKFGQRGVSWVDLTPQIFDFIKAHCGISNTTKDYTIEDVPIESAGYWSWSPLGATEEIRLRSLLDNAQIHIPIAEHYESFPAIAAYVTAYGRERLIELMEIAGRSNVYYCDTDSLFVNAKGLCALRKQRLIKANELGMLKVVGQSQNLILRGLKDYVFANTSKCKGIRKDAKEVKPNVFEQLRFEGIKSVLRRGGGSYVGISTIRKKLQRNYDKGVVRRGGKVTPLVLREF